MSSSAAVECATGFAINELFNLGLDKYEIAQTDQQAEHALLLLSVESWIPLPAYLGKKIMQ